MGNYISCSLSAGGGNKQWRSIKVVFPSGEISKFEEAIKAAELMVEMPSFFVVNTRSLQIGRRFCALHADEELEYGNVYVMIPMKKLNSAVTASDMGSLLITAKRVSAKVNKILPTAEPNLEMALSQPQLNLDDIDQDLSMHRLSICSRSKKPLLETIAEEKVC